MVAAIIISAFFGVLLYYLADRRSYNKQFWLIMGILFGPFSLPFIFLGKKRHNMEKKPTSEKIETKILKITLPKELFKRVEALCAEKEMTTQDFVTDAIIEKLELANKERRKKSRL